jgi:nitronate monooxygenase
MDMVTTRFTQLLGCSVPIQQAGMGDLARPRPTAAVANAGGLGMVGVYGIRLPALIQTLDQLRAQTTGLSGANFILHFVEPAEARVHVAAAAEIMQELMVDAEARL